MLFQCFKHWFALTGGAFHISFVFVDFLHHDGQKSLCKILNANVHVLLPTILAHRSLYIFLHQIHCAPRVFSQLPADHTVAPALHCEPFTSACIANSVPVYHVSEEAQSAYVAG